MGKKYIVAQVIETLPGDRVVMSQDVYVHKVDALRARGEREQQMQMIMQAELVAKQQAINGAIVTKPEHVALGIKVGEFLRNMCGIGGVGYTVAEMEEHDGPEIVKPSQPKLIIPAG
jgi:hypothetical protein